MHVCVTKHHWLLALRLGGLAWGLLLGRGCLGPPSSWGGRGTALDPEGRRAGATRLAGRVAVLLIWKLARPGPPHLLDCTPASVPGPPGTFTHLGPPSLFPSVHQVLSGQSSPRSGRGRVRSYLSRFLFFWTCSPVAWWVPREQF